MDVSFTGILSHVEAIVKGGMESGTYTAADLCFSLQVNMKKSGATFRKKRLQGLACL